MRLRLVVRRQDIPDVKLVWSVASEPDFTIAKLLSDVSEAIPLESAEWGLEDYVVELLDQDGDTFECLHFLHAAKLLHDGDLIMYVCCVLPSLFDPRYFRINLTIFQNPTLVV
jgi:hypothetical protein